MKKYSFWSWVILGIISLTFGIAALPDETKAAAPGSQITTSTTNTAQTLSFQRKSFFAQGRFWVFYASPPNISFRTSTDGISWSAAGTLRSGGLTSGDQFSVWSDGTSIYYAFTTGAAGAPIYFRKGSLNAAGTISWVNGEVTAVAGAAGVNYNLPSIAVDTTGRAWIGYRRVQGGTTSPMIARNNNTNGTWANAPGFPFNLGFNAAAWAVAPVPLDSGGMVAVYCTVGQVIRGRSWNGSAWVGGFATTQASSWLHFSVVGSGEDVHLAFLNTSQILYCRYNITANSLSSEVPLVSGVTSTTAPVLSIDPFGDVHLFWANSSSERIFYKQYSGGVWDPTGLEIVNDPEKLNASNALSAPFYMDPSQGKIVFYLTKSASPFNLKSSRGASSISIKKTGPTSAFIGDTIAFQIQVKNNGTSALSNVTVTDSQLGYSNNIGSLAAGASAGPFSINTTIPNGAPSVFVNSAEVTATASPISVSDRDDWAVKIKNPIEVIKTAQRYVFDGNPINYEIKVKNIGEVSLTDVTIVDSSLGVNQGPLTLSPGAMVTINKSLTAQGASPIINTVNVTAKYNGNPVSNSATWKMYPITIRKEIIGDPQDDTEFEVQLKDEKGMGLETITISQSKPQKIWFREGKHSFKEIILYPSCYRLVPDGSYIIKHYPQYDSEFAQIDIEAGVTQVNTFTFKNKNHCKICIDKTGPDEACLGDRITYTIKVWNCSDPTPRGGNRYPDPPDLIGVKVNDPTLGIINQSIGDLPYGSGQYIFTKDFTLPMTPGAFNNTATASGWHPLMLGKDLEKPPYQPTGKTYVNAQDGHSVNVKVCQFTGQICGTKFDDFNGNGQKDPGDLGVPNIQITLFSETLTPLDSVDIGNPSSESGHNLFGWGPIEPDTHGGSWGGIGTDPLSPDKKTRVTWFDDEQPWALFKLDAGPSAKNLLKLRVLDGVGDDSFDVYVNGDLIYSYLGKNNPNSGGQNLFGQTAGSGEFWNIHQLYVPYSGELVIAVVATGGKWSLFDPYGQLAVDWAELYALSEFSLPGNPTTTNAEGRYCFTLPNLNQGTAYHFFVAETGLPDERVASSPSVLGPITLTQASPTSDGNDFGNIPVCLDPPWGMVGWWPGDGNAKDIAGGNDGTVVGGMAYVSGKVGQAFSLNGGNSVRVPNSPNLEPSKDITVDTWVKSSGPGNYSYILSKGAQACDAASYALYTGTNGGLYFYIFDGSTVTLSPDAGPGIWDGKWHHIAGTYDGSKVRLYVDGVEVGSGTSKSTTIKYGLSTTNDLFIGTYEGGSNCSLRFQGEIDEVEIYNRALSAEEIMDIFAAGRAGKCKGFTNVKVHIDLEKYVSVDNQQTWEDADTPPGPTALVGQDVYFKFYVQNTGSVPLFEITLSDTDFNAQIASQCTTPYVLFPGDSFECVIGPIAAISGQHANTATVTGKHEGDTFSDSDDAHYFGQVANPKIKIKKSWQECAAFVGSEITYRYEVTNEGNVPLSDVTVSDTKCSPVTYVSGDTNTNNKLDLTEKWIFHCSYTPSFSFPNALENEATATGWYQSTQVQDKDKLKIYPFILRKEVFLYWDSPLHTILYPHPHQEDWFFANITKNGTEECGAVEISESSPAYLWLSEGSYQFCEFDIPPFYTPGYPCISYTTGQGYPDWTFPNLITYDLAIQKWGPPEACAPGEITFHYKVTNAGPASVPPYVYDSICSPVVYKGGDSNSNGLIDPGEEWRYECSYLIPQGFTGDLVNQVWVYDQNDPKHPQHGEPYPGWLLGGDRNLANNTATWTTKVGICAYPGRISGRKFADCDNDGKWEEGEYPILGWKIGLYQGSTLIRETLTAPDGSYSFLNLPNGTYDVVEEVPTGWRNTVPGSGRYNNIIIDNNQIDDLNFGNHWTGSGIQEPDIFTGPGYIGYFTGLDTTTMGFWQRKYGNCFYALPNPWWKQDPELHVGPDWYSSHPEQYNYNTNDPDQNRPGYKLDHEVGGLSNPNWQDQFDFRVFNYNNGSPTFAAAWPSKAIAGFPGHAGEQDGVVYPFNIVDDPCTKYSWTLPAHPSIEFYPYYWEVCGAQYKPSASQQAGKPQYFAVTWDSDDYRQEPLIAEVKIKKPGLYRVTFNVINPNDKTNPGTPPHMYYEGDRAQDFWLYINQDFTKPLNPVWSGHLDPWTGSIYLTFIIETTQPDTTVALGAKLTNYCDSGQCPKNAYISGIFVDCFCVPPGGVPKYNKYFKLTVTGDTPPGVQYFGALYKDSTLIGQCELVDTPPSPADGVFECGPIGVFEDGDYTYVFYYTVNGGSPIIIKQGTEYIQSDKRNEWTWSWQAEKLFKLTVKNPGNAPMGVEYYGYLEDGSPGWTVKLTGGPPTYTGTIPDLPCGNYNWAIYAQWNSSRMTLAYGTEYICGQKENKTDWWWPCTYTQGRYGGRGKPGTETLYYCFQEGKPAGYDVLLLGLNGPTVYSYLWELTGNCVNVGNPINLCIDEGILALQDAIGGGGVSGWFDKDAVNAGDMGKGGGLASQTAALTLNVVLSGTTCSGYPYPAGLGNLTYCNPGDSLNGKTIAEILAIANVALGSGVLPSGYTFSSLNDLITNFNEAFDDCGPPTSWAEQHICGYKVRVP
jgi:uncharacterized repeat protein (TIGR01451 family)